VAPIDFRHYQTESVGANHFLKRSNLKVLIKSNGIQERAN
jgi:hypothetical protein